eukprot:COSAG02_NODE_460_length_21907_cov_7.742617_7_plen_208_part_00
MAVVHLATVSKTTEGYHLGMHSQLQIYLCEVSWALVLILMSRRLHRQWINLLDGLQTGGKGRQWEGGFRVPYYIKAPGIVAQPGSTSEIAVSGIDFYATILDIVGISVPTEQDIDGVSLVPLLHGHSVLPAGRARSFFAHEPHYGNQGGEPASHVLQGDMKLVAMHSFPPRNRLPVAAMLYIVEHSLFYDDWARITIHWLTFVGRCW